MSPILEALPPKLSSTTSNYYNEWLNFLDEDSSITKQRLFNLPELSVYVVESPDGNWVLVNSETTGSGRANVQPEFDIIDYVESPIMPARKQFAVNLIIERIEKGLPSICDEVEL
jgi:hypothetical protein